MPESNAKALMVQGTMSNAGKTLLVAGLCRILVQDGFRVAPFKAQNMALNSYITRDGLEMGRAQVTQAEAARLEPDIRMNPILLKPASHTASQVIVNGEVLDTVTGTEYYRRQEPLVNAVMTAYQSLASEYEVIVLEGAGSAAELNLRERDLVNMGMARRIGAPVLLVGDIDRGGVFAQLYGTVTLLDDADRKLIKATVVNKFRGELSLFDDGVKQLEELCGVPVAGVLPFFPVDIDDEDSLAERLERRPAEARIDIAVVRFPYISNFTDLAALEATADVRVRYLRSADALGSPDLIVLPGSKNTLHDLHWLRESGLGAAIQEHAARNVPVMGICGGYQMLGTSLVDETGSEGGGSMQGLGLLPVSTEFAASKRRTRTAAQVLDCSGPLGALSGAALEGYEIHMGRTEREEGARALVRLEDGTLDGCQQGNIYGCYLHGFFDSASCRKALLTALCASKGIELQTHDFDLAAYRDEQYDILATGLRKHLNMDLIYQIIDGAS